MVPLLVLVACSALASETAARIFNLENSVDRQNSSWRWNCCLASNSQVVDLKKETQSSLTPKMRFEDLIKWEEIDKWLSLSESLKTTPIRVEWLRKSWARFIAHCHCRDEKGKLLCFPQHSLYTAYHSLINRSKKQYWIWQKQVKISQIRKRSKYMSPKLGPCFKTVGYKWRQMPVLRKGIHC